MGSQGSLMQSTSNGLLTWPPNSSDLNPIEHLWDVLDKQSLIHGDPTRQLPGLKGSAVNILLPDTTARLQGLSGVHVSMGHGCFGSKSGTKTSLGRWS